MNVARIPITADDPPNAPITDALTPANVIHEQEVYGELDDPRRNWVQTQRLELVARTVVDEERSHESAGGERDVEADEHVGEARREDGLTDVLRPAVADGRPGLFNCHYRVAKFYT
jgi:hypothetical protein